MSEKNVTPLHGRGLYQLVPPRVPDADTVTGFGGASRAVLDHVYELMAAAPTTMTGDELANILAEAEWHGYHRGREVGVLAEREAAVAELAAAIGDGAVQRARGALRFLTKRNAERGVLP